MSGESSDGEHARPRRGHLHNRLGTRLGGKPANGCRCDEGTDVHHEKVISIMMTVISS